MALAHRGYQRGGTAERGDAGFARAPAEVDVQHEGHDDAAVLGHVQLHLGPSRYAHNIRLFDSGPVCLGPHLEHIKLTPKPVN